MENNKITIGFRLTDNLGQTYENTSEVLLFEDLGVNTLEAIGDQLNAFLHQCGFMGRRDCMLMEGLTSEEYDVLLAKLEEMRSEAIV